jgi:hypothetical protein
MNFQYLSYLFIVIPTQLCQDYWGENFDENKNCEEEELIQKLLQEQNPSRCAKEPIGI